MARRALSEEEANDIEQIFLVSHIRYLNRGSLCFYYSFEKLHCE